jgi:hypothetical protein
MGSACCLCVCVCVNPPPRLRRMGDAIFMKLGMHIMAPQPTLTVYFINPSHQSICLCVYDPIVARQRLRKKHYRGNEYTRNYRRIVGRVYFYAVRVISRKVNY